MDPWSAAILAGASLLGGLGGSWFQGKQQQAINLQNSLIDKNKADQSVSDSLLQKQQSSLSNLIEAYRSTMMG